MRSFNGQAIGTDRAGACMSAQKSAETFAFTACVPGREVEREMSDCRCSCSPAGDSAQLARCRATLRVTCEHLSS